MIIPSHAMVESTEEVGPPGLARLLTQLPQRESELPGQREDGMTWMDCKKWVEIHMDKYGTWIYIYIFICIIKGSWEAILPCYE